MSNDTINSGPWPEPPANLTPAAPQVQAQKPGRSFRKQATTKAPLVDRSKLARVAIQPVRP